jgi:diguanylate cyclase (GGDEF)-like protein
LIVLSLQPAMATPVPAPAPAPASAPGAAGPAAPRSAPDPAAFDALLARLLGPELWREPSQQAVLGRLAELHRLLPPGDAARTLRYRALRCDWDFEDDPSGQLAYADDGLARARAQGDGAMEASFHYCRSAAIEALRNMPAAMPDIEAGIAIARRIGDQRLLADGLSLRAGTRSLLGDQSLAIPDLLEAQRLYQHAGVPDDAESLLQDIAISYRRMGDLDKAQEYFEQNEAYARSLGDWSQLISNLLQQGYLAEDQGRLDDALAAYREVLVLARRHDSDYDVASAYLAMAWPWMLRGDFDRGLALVQRARTGYATLGDDSNDDMVYLRLGQAQAGLGDHAQALTYFKRAAEALERSDNRRYLALLYRARADSERALGRYQDAFTDLQRYVALHEAATNAERGQQAQLLRSQFDSDRQELENNRLASEQALRERQLAVLRAAQRWQWLAMALGGVLVLLLALLVVRQLARMKRLREIASTDPLTGVANRRSIEQLGDEAVARTRAAGERLCALVLDVDHFKQVNDGHGHLTGDLVLARIAATFRHVLRHFDLLGRTGGEEFLVVLPDTGPDRAEAIAERLRAAIEAMDCSDIAAGLATTVSIGVACLGPADAGLQALVARADAALYRAKGDGRNRIVVDRA